MGNQDYGKHTHTLMGNYITFRDCAESEISCGITVAGDQSISSYVPNDCIAIVIKLYFASDAGGARAGYIKGKGMTNYTVEATTASQYNRTERIIPLHASYPQTITWYKNNNAATFTISIVAYWRPRRI